MQSIILIADNDSLLERIEALCKKDGLISFMSEKQLNIDLEIGRIYISLDSGIIADYDADELKDILHIFSNGIYFYLVCFSDRLVLENLMIKFLVQENLYIDDDMGNIISIADFKENLRTKN